MRTFGVTFLVCVLLTSLGCRLSWTGSSAPTETFAPQTAVSTDVPPPQPAVVADDQPSEPSQEQALADVLSELTELGALEPEAKQQLIADLREAKPENWPLIVRSFRSALSYRKQVAEREESAEREQVASSETTTTQPISRSTKPQSTRPTPVTLEAIDARPQAIAASDATRPMAVAVVPDEPIVLSKPPQPSAQQASYAASPTAPAHWQAHLQTAIHQLETSVQPSPGSPDEVNEHLRLRLLQLLAGNDESAMLPIPGATAPQQDYWNKQLFAVSTFLDSQQQPDDRRRAAGSLIHLDAARAKLAELATLQVGKLAFVDSVAGYGAYELHEGNRFRPGAQVTLYAEIENFSSESTEQGYRTRLATSYEVVDANGKRVDSDQFPEIEDLCLNPRRDFHMQYTITLPTRIYPETYQLRLIITDQHSHKIGQASVPFEIVE